MLSGIGLVVVICGVVLLLAILATRVVNHYRRPKPPSFYIVKLDLNTDYITTLDKEDISFGFGFDLRGLYALRKWCEGDQDREALNTAFGLDLGFHDREVPHEPEAFEEFITYMVETYKGSPELIGKISECWDGFKHNKGLTLKEFANLPTEEG